MKISTHPPQKKYHIMHAVHICFAFTLFLIEKIQYKSELNSTPMSEHVLQHFNLNDFLISSHKIWRSAYTWCCNTPIFLPYRLNTPLVEIPQAPGRCWEVEGVDVRKDHSACATLTSGDGEVWEAGNRWFWKEGAAETALLKRGSWEGVGGISQSERQGRRGDMLPALQPAAVISCQVLTSLSVFRWSKLPSALFGCCQFSSLVTDVSAPCRCLPAASR